jgi:hypothetical protein
MSSLIPSLNWYQTKEYIIFTIELQDVSNENITFTEDSFSFTGHSAHNFYAMLFTTFDKIIPEESSYDKQNGIKVILKKSENSSWSYLTKDKNQFKNNIKVNWNAWVDDDEEDESSASASQFDFQQMMAQMGGGGMPDFSSMMGGMQGEMQDGIHDGIDEEGDMLDFNNMPDEEECEECNDGSCEYHNEEIENDATEDLEEESS